MYNRYHTSSSLPLPFFPLFDTSLFSPCPYSTVSTVLINDLLILLSVTTFQFSIPLTHMYVDNPCYLLDEDIWNYQTPPSTNDSVTLFAFPGTSIFFNASLTLTNLIINDVVFTLQGIPLISSLIYSLNLRIFI